MTTKTIMVVVDLRNPSQAAIERAAGLAHALSADLELFVCHYDPDIAAGQFSTVWIANSGREGLMAILEGRLDELASALRQRGLNVTTDLIWDHPLDEAIVRKVVASQPWMVIKEVHHHNALKRTILTSTDWSLIQRCPVPLMLAKLDTSTALRKICAAIDPTHEHDKPAELDDRIFRITKTIADATGAALHAVHTYAVKTEPVGLEAPPIGKLTELIRQTHERVFQSFLETHPVAANNAHLLPGLAHERLVDFAMQESIDILVMGAISRRGLGRIFIGSTAERILDRLPCDLLIVSPAHIDWSSLQASSSDRELS